MLQADEIEALGTEAEQLFDPLIRWLLADICKRVAAAGQFTATAQYEIWKLQNLGVSQQEAKQKIAQMLNKSMEETEKLLTQSAEVGYNFDLSGLPNSEAIPFQENAVMQQIVNAAVSMARGGLENITQTMGFVTESGVWSPLSDAYIKACDSAFMKVSTGTTSYTQALREATAGLRKSGITCIDYESGRHYTVEAAVRRSVFSAAGMMQEKISKSVHDDSGCDGWEISAHAASAPDHEPIQGKQYSDEAYKNLNNSLIRRIGTLNCGHAAFPIVLGVSKPQYSEKELDQFRKENEEGFEYGGKHYTRYEATQRQRQLERAIRRNRENILLDESIGDSERLQTDQIREVRLEEEYKRFSEEAGLKLQHERMEMAGYGPKQAVAAQEAADESIAQTGKLSTNQGWYSISVSGGQTETKYRKLKSEDAFASGEDAQNSKIDSNVINTNPAYKSGDPAYSQNCQRCVPAYEMRRRGFDVIARPAKVDTLGKISNEDPLRIKWKNVFEGADFNFYSGYDGGKAEIISQMGLWGDGAVAEVRVLWNEQEAHVFVAEQVNGRVRFVDPQTGDLDCERYFTRAVLGGTMMARIDNLEPSALIEMCIKNRGGKS